MSYMEEKRIVRDSVLIGEWKDVQDLPLSSITKRADDKEKLDGLIIKGYEMKWGKTNENGERYSHGAFDDFIKDYYIANGLNVVLDVQHDERPEWLCGRLLYIETNTVGFYCVAYIPRTEQAFEAVKSKLQNGLLQGFSKCGYVNEGRCIYKEDGTFDYYQIDKMSLLSVSLVATPANGVPFEGVGEVKNRLEYVNKTHEVEEGAMNKMFNKKKVEV